MVYNTVEHIGSYAVLLEKFPEQRITWHSSSVKHDGFVLFAQTFLLGYVVKCAPFQRTNE